MSEYLTRDAILQAEDIPSDDVTVPEWGGMVHVVGLTGTERDKMEASVVGTGKKMNLTNFRARLCSLCIADAEGNRLFSDYDVAALGHKSAAALARVFTAAQRLSGLSDADVDDLAGESEPDQEGSFISG
ncbi:MAG: hypothetical protein ACRDRO_08760 [Pseudonocardiaceae bacterium]